MDENEQSIAGELAEIGRLLDDDDVASVLQRFTSRAVRRIPGCDHATVTVGGDDGQLETVAGAEVSPVAHLPDAPAWRGPISDTVRYREPRRVDDSETEQRWPQLRERMRKAGFRSCLALPLPAHRAPSVGFTLFSSRPRQFVEHHLDLVALLALHTGTAFDNAALYSEYHQLVDHLHNALATRERIGKAQGILMRRFREDSTAAFERLRRVSQARNIKIRALAASVIAASEQDELEPLLREWSLTSEGDTASRSTTGSHDG